MSFCTFTCDHVRATEQVFERHRRWAGREPAGQSSSYVPGCCGRRRCYSGRSLHCPPLRCRSPRCVASPAAAWHIHTHTHKHQCVAANGGSHVITAWWWWWWWRVGRRLPGHGLDFQPLLYAVRQGLLVVVFANTGQDSLLVSFVLITTGINLA